MAGVRDVIGDLADQLDEELLGNLYAAVSIPTERVRAELRASRMVFLDPEAEASPSLGDLDAAAEWAIARSAGAATAVGGVGGLGGALTLGPETLAMAVAIVRLAQRLALIYGFDPETDRGHMALWRALAAGLEIELPDRGMVGMRASQLPAVVLRQPPPAASEPAALVMARALLSRSARMIGTRFTRLVPVVFTGFAALAARRRMREVGRRMQAVLRRLAEAPLAAGDGIEDAVEV